MKWITREKVKVDRVACPWLIKRFIDPEAEFLFVTMNEVASRAAELGATPFDIEGCELGHHGEDVSFNSFLHSQRRGGEFVAILKQVKIPVKTRPSSSRKSLLFAGLTNGGKGRNRTKAYSFCE